MNRKKLILAIILILMVVFNLSARQVKLEASLSHPLLEAEKKQTTFLKVSLTGFEMVSRRERPPVNIALVLDKSGSMSGEKIEQAKEAALYALDLLSDKDILSVVAYDDQVQVLVPSTRVSNRQLIRQGIRRLEAAGSTALYAGVSKGADELRKFLKRNQVNRVILLSDGQANVGPDTPGALGELGSSLIQEGISVTTIGLGLGYNEDLMAELARRSDGNHAFVKNSEQLVTIFKAELGDVLSVVAQEVVININCGEGIRPVRVLGREADISGNKVRAYMNQIYSNQEKYLLLEIEVPASRPGSKMHIADINISYANLETRVQDKLASEVAARFTEDTRQVKESLDKPTMEAAVMQIATETNKKAVKLRDEGRVEEAKEVLQENAEYLKGKAEELESDDLEAYGEENAADSQALDNNWNERRKSMRAKQSRNQMQQSY